MTLSNMKNPFIFTYEKLVKNLDNAEILNNFKINFENSRCDKVRIVHPSQLVVENEIFSFRTNWNIWYGIGKATINIEELGTKKIVRYFVNYSRIAIENILFFIVIISIAIILKGYLVALILFLGYPIIFLLGVFLPIKFSHKSLFRKTIELGADAEYIGDYDWKEILSNKTESELKEIAEGNTHLPKTIGRFAAEELERRKNINI